jgi:serine/threonine protein kinase
MPAPATVAELIDLIKKSGVIDEAKLDAYLGKQAESGPLPTDPAKCAGKLVRDAVLTYFQAEQLLQGKWKRFTIGKYKVLEKLGVGGMGQVFLCEHKLMRRRVAVKVLPAAKGQDDASRERFYQEARAVAALDHPNIVRAYDIDHDEGLHFLVMEFVDGVNLQDLVKRAGPLDPVRACHYVYGAAVGLQYASDTGIVHRDIKPGNILIDRTGVVKILDMGLARFFNDEDTSLTKKYDENVLGTADYLAPEQAVDSHNVTIRADLYSLGGTFYYLLTGHAPFPEGSVAQKLLWHQTRDPKSVSQVRPDVPAEIVAVVERLMKKDPNERFQTPNEVLAALQEFVQVPIPPPTEKELPLLSPAAGGPAASARNASGILIAGGTSTTQSTFELRSPYATVSVPGGSTHEKQAVQTMPGPQGSPAATAEVQVGVWASLDHDTAPREAPETALTKKTESLKGLQVPKKAANRRKLYLAAGIAAAVLAVGGIGYAVVQALAPAPAPPPPPPALDFARVYVTKGKGPDNAATFPSVREAADAIAKRAEFDPAARKAAPTIVLLDEQHQEYPFHIPRIERLKDLTITAENPAKPVVWKTQPGANVKRLLEIRGANALTIKGVLFDVEGGLDYGLVLAGQLAGVRLEDVTVRGAKKAAVRFENAAGEPGKPCVLNRVRLVAPADAEAAVQLSAPDKLVGAASNLNAFVSMTNCRLEGPGAGAAVAIDAPLRDFEFVQNRVYNFTNGVGVLQTPGPNAPFKAVVEHNTFHTLAGSAFFSGEADLPAKADVRLTRNYFAKTKAAATVKNLPAVPNFKSPENARDSASGDGNLAEKPVVVEKGELLGTDPDDDAKFLRYPKSSPLAAVGPNKVAVGATAE